MPLQTLDMIDKALIGGAFDKRKNHPYGKAGDCFSLRKDEVRSDYWVYRCEDMFTITISDILTSEDVSYSFEQSEYISLYYYDSIHTITMEGSPRLERGKVAAHISDGDLYALTYCEGTPLHGVAVNIMPAYYDKMLQHRLPGGFKRLKRAFEALNKRSESPEVLLIMRQLQNSRVTGEVASLYYESKINEAVAIVLSYKEKNTTPSTLHVDEEKQRLRLIGEYINQYYCTDIPLSDLAAMGNMSISKLKYCFKMMYGCTVTEYITNLRLEQAKKMLESGEKSITEIAGLVGYQKTGSFSRMFKRQTGVLPREYRRSSHGPQ